MKPFLLLSLFLLAGCQSYGGYNQMTPEQIAAATKDKTAYCFTVVSNAGVAKLVVVDITKGADVAINAENCSVITTTPPKAVPVKP